MSKYRIVLCDDHQVVRQGLKALIGSADDLEVIAEATSGRELLNLMKEIECDLVILDLSMPDYNGFDVLEGFKDRHPNTRVLVLSMHKDRDHFQRAVDLNVDGYVLKDDAFEELLGAIATVRSGKSAFSDSARAVVESLSAQDAPARIASLTRREAQILRMIASGKMNKDIGELLGISVRTVEFHRANLMEKLDFRNSTELVKFAVANGLT